jgi:hypothetical protein
LVLPIRITCPASCDDYTRRTASGVNIFYFTFISLVSIKRDRHRCRSVFYVIPTCCFRFLLIHPVEAGEEGEEESEVAVAAPEEAVVAAPEEEAAVAVVAAAEAAAAAVPAAPEVLEAPEVPGVPVAAPVAAVPGPEELSAVEVEAAELSRH